MRKNSSRARPVGVFGGIFDPVHNGHLAAACLARDFFRLERVLLVPAGIPPHKSGTVIADARHRLAMLAEAVAGCVSLEIWDEEIRRSGISYTIDTIRSIGEKYPGRPLYFIIGSDNLSEISTWSRWEEILASVQLCVAHRPGSSMNVPKELEKAALATFPSPEWNLSSTLIRQYLADGYSCDHLLPPGVVRYIAAHGLYKKGF
jgi:nicotinate-nucleotide adenylyltransferase